MDVEPSATLRGHTAAVYCCATGQGGRVYSAGADRCIRKWRLPARDATVYAPMGRADFYSRGVVASADDSAAAAAPAATCRALIAAWLLLLRLCSCCSR